ncbi:hypothetical protein [Acinetobacter sp. TYF_19]|uniref:hypothetical protein n=1 Tax=Acinetobacter sp. TYF_19 TaxID=3367196 RepID=UPI00370BEACD
MIVDFFEHGTGEASGPLDYFLGKNRDREHAKILLGDVNEVAELIDCSPYEKRYTSGCLSFYESDLTEADKAQIMRDFEKTLFPSLTTENYRVLWVEHRDKINEETGERRLELNFLIPNIEIESGKRLQPFFAKADLDRVDAFKKIVNYEHDLFDPDDPLNRRSVKIAQNLPKESKEFKAQVHDEITLAICDDLIYDRKTLLDWCETVGFEVTKITKKQISIKNPETGRPEVFKGEFYEQNFRNTAKSTELKAEASGRYRQRAEKRYQTCLKRHEKLCEAKSKYHLERYATRDRTDSTELTRQLESQKNNPANQHRQDGAERERGHEEDAREPTVTATKLEKGLADLKRIEPSNSRPSEAEKSPFFIEYSPSFNSTYFAYYEHQLRIHQQEQVRRDTDQRSTFAADRSSHAAKNAGLYGSNDSFIQSQRRAIDDDIRSAVIDGHRGAADAAKRATAAARAELEAHTGSESNYRRARELHENFKRQAQLSGGSGEAVSGHSEAAIGADHTAAFFRDFTERLTAAIGEAFNSITRWVERGATNLQSLATPDKDRDREAVRADDQASSRETGLSRALSANSTRFSGTPIWEALEKLELRKELQQQRERDRGYDSPSPF